MTHPEYLLLTGATGQIGRYLLRDLLLEGQPLAVVVRPQGDVSGEQRMNEIIRGWEVELGKKLPEPVCLEGDVSRSGYGMELESRHWIRDNCHTLLHNAAAVSFGGNDGHTWDSNISGARHTLDLCREAHIEHLAYVSTAYICGWQEGTIYEGEMLSGQEFRNEYEHSKFEAETMVRKAGAADRLTVLRPAIVLGDYTTGYTTTFHHFYRLAQFNSVIASCASRDENGRFRHNIRLSLSGDEIRNLVTVDWVSAAMSAIVLNPKWHGRTYHLTPQAPTTSREIQDALQQYFRYDGVEFVGPDGFDDAPMTVEEERFYEYFSEYEEYWRRDPIFDRRNTDEATASLLQPRVDVDCLTRLIDYAVATRFGRTRRSTRQRVATQ